MSVAYLKGLHLQKYKYSLICMCARVCVCTLVEASGHPLSVFPQALKSCSWLSWSWLNGANLMATKHQICLLPGMASISYHSWHFCVDFGTQTQVLTLARQVLYWLKHCTSAYLLITEQREGTVGHACNCTRVELEDNVCKLALSFHQEDREDKRTFPCPVSPVCILSLINLFVQFLKNIYFICVSILVSCT